MNSKKPIILPKHRLILETLGQNIKLARLRRKLTTEQVAERAGMHRATLHRLEKGDYSVAIGYYLNVLKTLNLHTDLVKVAEDDVFGRKLQDLELLGQRNDESNKISTLNYSLRNKIRVAIHRGSFTKNSNLTNIIGCTFEEFKKHLESNQYGFRLNESDIDLDHIVPTSKAKTEKELKELYHYSNLQLLPAYYNRNIKGDRDWNKEDFKEWFKTF